MLGHERRRLARRAEALARRALCALPAPVLVVLALAGAWSINAWARGRLAAGAPAPCGLHVVVTQRPGRIVWIVTPSAGAVRSGDVLARLDGAAGGFELNSPAAGLVRSVLRKGGETVQPGDPLIVLGPPSGTSCP